MQINIRIKKESRIFLLKIYFDAKRFEELLLFQEISLIINNTIQYNNAEMEIRALVGRTPARRRRRCNIYTI